MAREAAQISLEPGELVGPNVCLLEQPPEQVVLHFVRVDRNSDDPAVGMAEINMAASLVQGDKSRAPEPPDEFFGLEATQPAQLFAAMRLALATTTTLPPVYARAAGLSGASLDQPYLGAYSSSESDVMSDENQRACPSEFPFTFFVRFSPLYMPLAWGCASLSGQQALRVLRWGLMAEMIF